MKLFTAAEANALLPTLRPKLEAIRDHYAKIDAMREDARLAAASSASGGGMKGGTGYVNALYRVGKLTTDIHEMGVELKDYQRGLIDFPSMRGQNVVLLCWQLGEGDQIVWWHQLESGFAGRQPL